MSSDLGLGGTAVVELHGVGVRRGPATILRGVDWRVEPGQNWVLLGANGSGKTSLLNVLPVTSRPARG
jgi:iron complex transport system ATP-binding protein